MKKQKRKRSTLIVPASDSDAGLLWLEALGEPYFRDSVLHEVFRRMRSAGAIEWFENIHGRSDKGVDYLLVTNTTLGRIVIGVQVKGKPITRNGAGTSLSANDIAADCVASMQHDFSVQVSKRRLDMIAVWCSASITSDAEEEFARPGLTYRVQVKKPRDILATIEQYAPALLHDVPQLALTRYIKEQAEPIPEAVRVFGCRINPKVNFLEPELARSEPGAFDSIETRKGIALPKKAALSLNKILEGQSHIAFFAGELSGKTYLLKRCKSQLAEKQKIPVWVTLAQLQEVPRSAAHLVAKVLRFMAPVQVEEVAAATGIVLMVDDIERVPQRVREWLFSLDSRQFRVITAGKSIVVPEQTEALFIIGAKLASVPHFLKSLSVEGGKALLDRAQAFIERTLATSRLPSNAFTISIMLQECQHGGLRFSTPTMGRLIERFVELQLGSHTEARYNVDFETKRDFLSHLAGKSEGEISVAQFRRRLGKFIETSKHPHSIDDFVDDFRKSGVFFFTEEAVRWAHPAFRQYFWVRNLLQNGKYDVIAKALYSHSNMTIGALTGSQIRAQDVSRVVQPLIDRLRELPSRDLEALVLDLPVAVGISEMISDEEEEKLLGDLEIRDRRDKSEPRHPLAEITRASFFASDTEAADQTPATADMPKIDAETKTLIRKRITAWMEQVAQNKLDIAFNLSSVLVNARKAKYDMKQQALAVVLKRSRAFSDLLHQFFLILLPGGKNLEFMSFWWALFAELHIADRMVGDPFLLNVFRRMERMSMDDEERLQLLDLLLCCGDDVSDKIVAALKKINRFDVTFAVYMRIVGLYYFRHHRDVDRNALRKLLRDIRVMDRTSLLPKVQA